MEEKVRPTFNPREVKANKSLLLKKLHTKDKMAQLMARKAGLHLMPGQQAAKIMKSKSVAELHKKAAEYIGVGGDLSMLGLNIGGSPSPVNIKIASGGYGRNLFLEDSIVQDNT